MIHSFTWVLASVSLSQNFLLDCSDFSLILIVIERDTADKISNFFAVNLAVVRTEMDSLSGTCMWDLVRMTSVDDGTNKELSN